MKRENRKQARAARDRRHKQRLIFIGVLLAALAGWSLWKRTTPSGGTVDIPHIHGLGFSADGEQLIVPAHDGLQSDLNGIAANPFQIAVNPARPVLPSAQLPLHWKEA